MKLPIFSAFKSLRPIVWGLTALLLTLVCCTAAFGQSDIQQQIDSIKQLIDRYDQQDSIRQSAKERGVLMMTYYNNFMNDQYMAEVDDQLEWLEMNGQWNVYYLVRGFEVQTLIHMDKLQTATREASALKKHAQQRHDEGGLALAYLGMADIYSASGLYREASIHYRKALSLPKKMSLYYVVLDNAYIMQAIALLQLNHNEELLQHCKEWEVWLRTGVVGDGDFFYCRLSNCESLRAQSLTKLGRYGEAERCLWHSEEYTAKVHKSGLTTIANYNLLLSRCTYFLAHRQAQEAMACLDSMNVLLPQENDISEERADALMMLGRGEEGAAMYKQLLTEKDSTFTRNMNKQLDELNTLYHVDELQMQNKLERNRFAIVIVIIVALAIIIFITFRYFAVRRMARLKAKSERMETELRVAHDIQMGMVPQEFPAFPDHPELDIYASITPAKEVGGDLYDYAIHGNHLYFCLGDVSGKGVPASLFMTTAVNLFRVASHQQLAPAAIAMQMNETLNDNNASCMFVTLFIGRADLLTGRVELCNCGHNPPVIISGGTPHFLELQSNCPLGIMSDIEFQSKSFDNIIGQSFFLYSDGLNEAENPLQEQFGDEHILRLLAAHPFVSCQDTIELMKSEVARHTNGAEQSDDLTMLCLKIG
jgi:serine phosphatase RsbU (regulator of sigma subunit)/tetratricopeptide (TPR) repeat protein